jgi:hypothetical protein
VRSRSGINFETQAWSLRNAQKPRQSPGWRILIAPMSGFLPGSRLSVWIPDAAIHDAGAEKPGWRWK